MFRLIRSELSLYASGPAAGVCGTVDGIAYIDMYVQSHTGQIVDSLTPNATRLCGLYVIDFKSVDEATVSSWGQSS